MAPVWYILVTSITDDQRPLQVVTMQPGMMQHNEEILSNQEHWARKPVLHDIYRGFHTEIASRVRRDLPGMIVELGSGIGNIREVLRDCIRTDLFARPWIDRIENAYALSFGDHTVSNIILFDVFHHLRYPGTALRELHRVLHRGGRVIIFEPCMSLLGLIVYGLCHPEPLGLTAQIKWFAPADWSPQTDTYYAAQGNATRVFLSGRYAGRLRDWRVIERRRVSALSYVASGGYSGPQIYPRSALPAMRRLDALCDLVPSTSATRLLVVLEKRR